jgi:hypothetical protein
VRDTLLSVEAGRADRGTQETGAAGSSDEAEGGGIAAERIRKLFDGWERPAFDPGVNHLADWRESIAWDGTDDDVFDAIRVRSVPVVEQRLRRLWHEVGKVLASDPVLTRVHGLLRVESLHNGYPTETIHVPSSDDPTILMNDATADFTRHVALTFSSWMYHQQAGALSDRPDVKAWADAYPVLRRIMAFESWSIAYDGLAQPFEFHPPEQFSLFAEYAVSWSLAFWLGHELIHAVRSQAISTERITLLGEDVTKLIVETDASSEEAMCDRLAFAIARAVPHPEFGDVDPGFPLQTLINTTFAPLAIAESRRFIRHARGDESFVTRWSLLHDLVRDLEGDPEIAVILFGAGRKFYRETVRGSDASWAKGEILGLVAECNFAELVPSQRNGRATREISELDDVVRLYLMPSSVVAHTAERLIETAIVTGADLDSIRTAASPKAVADAGADTIVPRYDETFQSRDFFLGADIFRVRYHRWLQTVDDSTRKAIYNPQGGVTFAEWRDTWWLLAHPVYCRVLHEVASDRWPIVAHDTRGEQTPMSPPSSLPYYGSAPPDLSDPSRPPVA